MGAEIIRGAIDKTSKLDEIVEAHKYMESNRAKEEIVVKKSNN